MDVSAYRRRRRRFEVNIVPMVDVMTVLIFFFLLTMQFKEIRSVEITPPSMASSEPARPSDKPAAVGVTSGGEFYFNDSPVSREGLASELARLRAANPEASVILIGDRGASWESVASALDAIREAKIKKAGIQSGAEFRK